MFSSTLKRSAATLGVVAGLLAAAGPASAQILDGPLMWDTPRANNTWGPIVYVGTDGGGLTLARNLNDVEAIDLNALGTQVGSEGVKAPTPTAVLIQKHDGQDAVKAPTPTAGTQVGSEGVKRNGRGFFDIPAELNTFGGNDTLRANSGTQIGIED